MDSEDVESSAHKEIMGIIAEALLELGLGETSIEGILNHITEEMNKAQDCQVEDEVEEQAEAEKRNAARKALLEQLIEAENSYVKSLNNLVAKYLTPLRNLALFENPQTMRNKLIEMAINSPMKPLRKIEVDTIFCNIEQIYFLHSSLLEKLQDCLQRWPQVPVGDIFVKLIPEMRIYVPYINNSQHAKETLRMSQNSKAFMAFLQKVSPTGGTKELENYLFSPMKQITQYKMMLKILCEQTRVKSEDHTKISKALEEIKKLQKLIHHNRQQATKLQEIQKRIVGFKENVPDKLSRGLLYEGPLSLVEKEGKTEFYCFLFNDLLVFTKHISQNQLRFKAKILIQDATVKDLTTVSPYDPVSRTGFIFSTRDEQTFVLASTSPIRKAEWIRCLEAALNVNDVNKVFGVRLSDLMNRENETGTVPSFIERAIKHLDQHALDLEGIFRVSGRSSLLQSFKEAIDSGVPIDLSSVDNYIVSSLVKLFFRELPEPIVPPSLFNGFVNFKEGGNPIKTLQNLVDQLPATNWNLMEFICRFLAKVCTYSEKNKMTPANLAVVFGPNFIWQPSFDNDHSVITTNSTGVVSGGVHLSQSLKINTATEELIKNHDKIFIGPHKPIEKFASTNDFYRSLDSQDTPSPSSPSSTPTVQSTGPNLSLSRSKSTLGILRRSTMHSLPLGLKSKKKDKDKDKDGDKSEKKKHKKITTKKSSKYHLAISSPTPVSSSSATSPHVESNDESDNDDSLSDIFNACSDDHEEKKMFKKSVSASILRN